MFCLLFLMCAAVRSSNFNVRSDIYSTWGSRFITGEKYHFAMSEHFHHNCGIGCWDKTSTCGIWRSPKTDNGQFSWKFMSFLSNSNESVPFCHDFAVTLESNGTHNVLMGYVTPKFHRRTGEMQKAYFGQLNGKICKSGIVRFDYKTYVRKTWLVYNILDPNISAQKQIDDIFSTKGINTNFKWMNIVNKLPPRYRSVDFVNPQPLISSITGYGTLINGERYSLHRSSGESSSGPNIEILVIVKTNKFAFENDARYTEVLRINYRGLREDGWFETDGKTFTIIYHDLALCSSARRGTCGAIIRSNNLMNWSNPKIFYESINNFVLRQRPSIFRTDNKTYLCTSSARKNAGFYGNRCNGGSSTFCTLI